MNSCKRFLLIEECDFSTYPTGGQLSFARQMLHEFGQQLALVGIVTDDHPVGTWSKRVIDGTEYDFYALYRKNATTKKSIIPARIRGYIALRRDRKKIMDFGIRSAFVQGQHTLKAVHDWGWDSLCYRFPGVENPLAISKYSWSKQFSGSFDKWFFPAFKNVDVALAAADQNAIQGLLERADGLIGNEQIKQFPTRVNTLHFHPGNCDDLREKLAVPDGHKLIVTSGRLHWVKGWSFLLDSFKVYHEKEPRSKLVFVGDGCDRQELESQAEELGIRDSVQVTGYQQPADVAEYLRAADLFVLGSEKEGWCTSLLEALACGKPIVSTDVSSARDIVKDGVNGFVVRHRDPLSFADAMAKAQNLNNFCAFTEKEIHKYALSNLATDLAKHWSILKPENCRTV